MMAVLSGMLAAAPLLAFGGGHLTRSAASAIRVAHEIRDEADPNDEASCDALGRLDITFRTEKKGPPTVGMVVTDPRGRRIGFDPVKNNGWQELPQAQGFIDCDLPDGEGACHGIIQVCGPVSGAYKLEVIAQQTAEYSVSISGRSEEIRKLQSLQSANSETELNDVAIRKGSRDILYLNYSRDPSSKIALQLQQAAPVARNEH
jgi:hypothetical protein